MLRIGSFAALILSTACWLGVTAMADDDAGWISLFDGKSLDGWTVSENPQSFSVEDGKIIVDGPRGHLFYSGDVANHNFKNFHFKADVMTFPRATRGSTSTRGSRNRVGRRWGTKSKSTRRMAIPRRPVVCTPSPM